MSRRSPEQRAQDLEDALHWMRNKGDEEDANDPTGDFRKLDSLLPKKRSQKADKEFSEAIDLWRDNGGRRRVRIIQAISVQESRQF